ncbi:MAG: cytochrome c peroxidase [Bacteroidales bacterium]|nr:cytochrome c peroxidase [Bacteroidales bacterium]
MNFKIIYLFLFFILGFGFQSCKKEKPLEEYNPTPYIITIPKFFPTQLNIPADNPMTVEGIKLGRYLFYEGRLAGRDHPDSMMSCATCHIQSNSFENGTGYGYGVTGIKTPHVMLPFINLVFNSSGYLWNGGIYMQNPILNKRNLEDLTWMAITAPHEMLSDTNIAKEMLQNIPMYPSLFKKAFGSEIITIKNAGKAIAQFLRTMISANSKFDRFLRGEENLTPSEMNGYVVFNTEKGDCFHCHGTILFTTNLFYNNAKDTVYTDARDRYHVTFDTKDIGAYKATTLRNIELTGPYMHDGRFTSLQQVIDFYSEGLVWSPYVHPLMKKVNDGGAQLTTQEKQDLIFFLKTLTDNTFINNPEFSNPF